jgi:hypothetical protein
VTFGSGGQRSIQLSYGRMRSGGGISRVLSPRSRGEDHFSGTAVADGLEQPTRDSDGAGRSSSPIWPCSGWGLPCHPVTGGAVRSYRTVSPLPVPRGPSAVCSLLHFPSPRDARALPGTLPCGARTFLDALRAAAILTRLPNCPRLSQCPGEDSNLHAVSGTRSLVWPVYQFQHLGTEAAGAFRGSAPERTRTSTGLRPLDPESSASTSSATGALPKREA